MTDLEAQLIDTWQINNRINLYMLEAIPAEALSGVSASKGWNVGQQFAHIHNIRLLWLKPALPAALEGLAKIEKDAAQDKSLLAKSLADSGLAVESVLRNALANGGRVKGFKPHVSAFLGYMIAHDSYHRAEVGIILTQSGHPLDKSVAFGIWEWGSR